MSEPADLLTAVLSVERRVNELNRDVAAAGDALIAEISDRQAGDDLLGQRLDQVEGAAGDPSSESAGWAQQATGEDWHELAGWVDWLLSTYEVSGERRVPPCWPAHPGAVEELAALWLAWQAATTTAPARRGDAMTAWHDTLARAVARLSATPLPKRCAEGHRDPVALPGTDVTLLPRSSW